MKPASSPRPRGTCRLCREDKELLDSHFVPAALYPKGKKISYATRTSSGAAPAEVKAHLLCRECEERFNRNGESEVLRLLAPKITRKPLPLLSKVQNATPLRSAPDGSRVLIYSGPSVGIDTKQFAYFALSLAWRASVHEWTLPDGTRTLPCDLGRDHEPVRRFLLGMAPFPSQTAVVMTVCTDDASRAVWIAPSSGVRDEGCSIFRIQMVGLILIVWLGPGIPDHIKEICCWSAPEKPFLGADCAHVTRDMLGDLQPL
jgi:hypothetical protein